jgi:glutamate racemase
VIDSGAAVARQAQRVLEAAACRRTETNTGVVQFATTGDRQAVAPALRRLWSEAVELQSLDW